MKAVSTSIKCSWSASDSVRLTFGANARILPGELLALRDYRLQSTFLDAALYALNQTTPLLAPLGRGTLSTRCDFQVLEARAVNATSTPARGSWVKVAAAGSERLPWPSASRALCTGEVCGEGRGSRPRNGSKSASTAPRPRRIGRSQAIAKRASPGLVVGEAAALCSQLGA